MVRISGLQELMDDEEVELNGSTGSWGLRFRYQFNLGYRFGGGKNELNIDVLLKSKSKS